MLHDVGSATVIDGPHRRQQLHFTARCRELGLAVSSSFTH